MITRVQIKNFRNLADVDVHLGPLTVLVGRNGAGKSTFLDALRFVRDVLQGGLNKTINQNGGIQSIRCRSSKMDAKDIEITLEEEGVDFNARYSFTIGTEQEENQQIKNEVLRVETPFSNLNKSSFETNAGKWVRTPADFPTTQKQMSGSLIPPDTLMLPTLANFFPVINAVFGNITATNYYSVLPNVLRIPQRQSSVSLLFEDGQNLATTLQSILRDGEFQPDLVAVLARVVEGVQDIRVLELGGYLVIELKKTQRHHSLWFPLAQESDGTLRVLALLAALYQKAPNHLIAIEEPELSIHPGVLAVLGEVIEEASTRSQVIISTQSPDLISRFNVDQLRVVEMVDGNTHIGPIEEGQRESINKQLFSAGDLLRIEGLHVSQEESTAVHA